MNCVWDLRAELGEGPLWLAAEQALLFVDIDGRRVHRYSLGDGATRSWELPGALGCVAPRRGGGFVAAGASGFVGLELPDEPTSARTAGPDAPTSAPPPGVTPSHPPVAHAELGRARLTPIVDPEAGLPGNRFNDGCCDPAGRFWAGSMDRGCSEPSGALWRLDPDGQATRADHGYAVSNGPAFAPDGATLYIADTVTGLVHAHDCDPASGALSGKRVFARLPAGRGLPDGLTVDAEGGLWAAVWDGGRLVRWHPDGRLDRELRVPVARPTKCAFGGPALDLLFVTSSRGGLDAGALARQPLAGGLFVCRPGLAGLPPQEFAG